MVLMSLNFLKRLTASKKNQKLQSSISVHRTSGLVEQRITQLFQITMGHAKLIQEANPIHLSFCFVNYGQGAIPLLKYFEVKGWKQENCGLVNIQHMKDRPKRSKAAS